MIQWLEKEGNGFIHISFKNAVYFQDSELMRKIINLAKRIAQKYAKNGSLKLQNRVLEKCIESQSVVLKRHKAKYRKKTDNKAKRKPLIFKAYEVKKSSIQEADRLKFLEENNAYINEAKGLGSFGTQLESLLFRLPKYRSSCGRISENMIQEITELFCLLRYPPTKVNIRFESKVSMEARELSLLFQKFKQAQSNIPFFCLLVQNDNLHKLVSNIVFSE